MATLPDVRPLPVQLNLNVRGLKASATLAINERSDQLREQGRTVYKLGLGQSPFPVVPPVVEALRSNAFRKDYLEVKGLKELREAVAGYYCRRVNACYTGDHVLIGPGSKELMFLVPHTNVCTAWRLWVKAGSGRGCEFGLGSAAI